MGAVTVELALAGPIMPTLERLEAFCRTFPWSA
jgi:hypothetical protein